MEEFDFATAEADHARSEPRRSTARPRGAARVCAIPSGDEDCGRGGCLACLASTGGVNVLAPTESYGTQRNQRGSDKAAGTRRPERKWLARICGSPERSEAGWRSADLRRADHWSRNSVLFRRACGEVRRVVRQRSRCEMCRGRTRSDVFRDRLRSADPARARRSFLSGARTFREVRVGSLHR